MENKSKTESNPEGVEPSITIATTYGKTTSSELV